MAQHVSMTITYVISTFCFVYFLVDVLNAYFARDVITDIIDESPVEVSFPAISRCLDLNPKLKNNTLDNNDITIQTLIKNITVERFFANSSKSTQDQNFEISQKMFTREKLLCLSISVVDNHRKTPDLLRKILHIDFNVDIIRKRSVKWSKFDHCAMTEINSLPRGLFAWFRPRPWPKTNCSAKFSRTAIQYLPRPFASNCISYKIFGFESRDHCRDSCILSKMGNSTVLKRIPTEQITGLTYSNITTSDFEACNTKCFDIDCYQEIYKEVDKSYIGSMESLPGLEALPPLLRISNTPRFSISLTIIYLGDLLAIFFGCSIITINIRSVKYMRKLIRKYSNLTEVSNLRCLRKTLSIKVFCYIFCAIGFGLQISQLLSVYLSYRTHSLTLINNQKSSKFTGFTICQHITDHPAVSATCRALNKLRFQEYGMDRKKCDQIATRNYDVDYMFKNIVGLDQIVNSIKILDNTFQSKVFEDRSLKVFIKNQVTSFIIHRNTFLHCFKFDVLKGQCYNGELMRTADEVAVLINFTEYEPFYRFKFMPLWPTMLLFYDSDGGIHDTEYYGVFMDWSGQTKSKIYSRKITSRHLLPKPFSNCIDYRDIGFKSRSDCEEKCFRSEGLRLYGKRISNCNLAIYENSSETKVDLEWCKKHDTSSPDLSEIRSYCKDFICRHEPCVSEHVKVSPSHISQSWYVKRFDDNYNVKIASHVLESFAITAIANITLMNLIVSVAGIAGVWFGISFSNFISIFDSCLKLTVSNNNISTEFRKILKLTVTVLMIVTFFYLNYGFISYFLKYETTTVVSEKYLTTDVAPSFVSICNDVCEQIHIPKGSNCQQQVQSSTVRQLVDSMRPFTEFFNWIAIRDSYNYTWSDFTGVKLHKYIDGSSKYLDNGQFCYLFQLHKYNLDSAQYIQDMMIYFQIKLNEYNRTNSWNCWTPKVHFRNITFRDSYIVENPIYKSTYHQRQRILKVQSKLLPYPYDTDCFDYRRLQNVDITSQASCFDNCLLKALESKEQTLYESLITRFDESQLITSSQLGNRLLVYKKKCSKHCRHRNCEMLQLRLQNAWSGGGHGILQLNLGTRLLTTQFQPKMLFAELVIYSFTFLGILFGLDALAMNSLWKRCF